VLSAAARAALVGTPIVVGALGCSGERYARPSGPAPRYETAPVASWDAGSAQGVSSATNEVAPYAEHEGAKDAGRSISPRPVP
jgi:hypothetical protein